jgi:hypothetical protein
MENSFSTNGIFLNIHYYPSQQFLDEEEIIFENNSTFLKIIYN